MFGHVALINMKKLLHTHHTSISVRKSTFRHQDPYLKEPSKVVGKDKAYLKSQILF